MERGRGPQASEGSRGRPLLTPRRQRTVRLQVPLAPAELELIKQGAALAHDEPAPWARKILLMAAEGKLVPLAVAQRLYLGDR